MTDIATAFVEALVARGVTLRAHGKKGLALHPKSAYGELSAAERATLKACKASIVKIVRAGTYATTAVEPQAAHVAPPAPCPHCYRTPCIGEGHPLYDLLHPLTERQAFERRRAQQRKDLHEMEVRQALGLPSPRWDV